MRTGAWRGCRAAPKLADRARAARDGPNEWRRRQKEDAHVLAGAAAPCCTHESRAKIAPADLGSYRFLDTPAAVRGWIILGPARAPPITRTAAGYPGEVILATHKIFLCTSSVAWTCCRMGLTHYRIGCISVIFTVYRLTAGYP